MYKYLNKFHIENNVDIYILGFNSLIYDEN